MAVQFWGPGVEEVLEIEMHESDTESDDYGYAVEVGKEVGVDGLDPFYSCHGIAGSSIYVDGRYLIVSSLRRMSIFFNCFISPTVVYRRFYSDVACRYFRDVRRKNCYRNMCAEFAKICLAGQSAFSEQRLLCSQEPHFFLNPNVRDEAALVGSPEDLFKRMIVPFRAGAPDLCSLADTRAFFDQCVRDVASDRLASVYWQNTTPASVGITSCFCELHDLHVEDNYLDSANVIRFGEVGSGKVWLLVHPRSFYDLTVALGDSIGRLRILGCDDVSDYLEGCPTPANHKNISITSEYLQARKIPHQFITQRPGDLVYVGPGSYHQVINLGIGVAEAVNVGGPRWNAGADRFITCRCPSNAVGYVPSNPTVTAVVRDRSFRRHVCPTDGCPFIAALLPHIRAHAQVEDDPTGSSKHHACSLCPKIYKQKCHLMRHHQTAHTPGGTPKKACRWCGGLKSASNMSKHERICSKS
ncbi:hypothetical protein TSAR_014633 [Trichomalopsis sarcophagae]|uniref:C2H2-type domain-containing protein n=1 Tax=Trichomalopsis sarcophagae TaxID=543379 RepID=A0A232EEC2_9HYME|nr:hypothetical protein TSAR_014633 [Trichomalopsis sarcophagae]